MSTDTVESVSTGDDPSRPEPVWQPDRDVPMLVTDQLEAELRRRIADGRLTGKLPGEEVMAPMYGVSRATLREVTDRLKASGLLTTLHRRGTFVTR